MKSITWIRKAVPAGCFFAPLLAALWIGCGNTADDDDDDKQAAPVGVEPHRETRGKFIVAWLKGTPYEMGKQHGELLREELINALAFIDSDPLLSKAIVMAEAMGMVDVAEQNSYPDVLEECQGLVDAMDGTGWTMAHCLVLNFGDVFVEALPQGLLKRGLRAGCSQIIATGPATKDGRLYHARILDWSKIDYILDYPTIFVRQPDGGVAHVYIGFPGNISPYSGMNVNGLSIASNEADPVDDSARAAEGRSHVQMQGQLLKTARNFDEARAFILGQEHMSVEIFALADGINQEGAVFEMTAKAIGARELADGLVYVTNHFTAPETVDLDGEPIGQSSGLRFQRLGQLLSPDTEGSYYGKLDPETLIKIMRDRVNPETGVEADADVFENDAGLATNGALFQIVFDPAKLLFWVAAGAIPVPAQKFVGFSLGEMLNLPDAIPVEPAVFE